MERASSFSFCHSLGPYEYCYKGDYDKGMMVMKVRGYYMISYGDTLASIANQFGISTTELMKANGIRTQLPFVGQPLAIPFMSDNRQQEYRPVTAYTVTEPILVNREDINTGTYPVLNYKPENAQFPFVYVPIAEFRRVGANVVWDAQKQLLTVVSDYDELEVLVQQLQVENNQLRNQLAALQPSVRGNTSGNIANWGIATTVGDWVYFSNISQENKLFKMRVDGTGKEKLADDPALYLNVSEGWIYYINQGDQAKIYRIRLDGSGREKVDDDHSATVIAVVGDWIYYVTQSEQYKLYKIKVDGTSKTQVGTDFGIEEMYATEDWIFYTLQNENLRIYKIKTDGTKRTNVTDYGAKQLNIEGDWMYFVNQSMPGVWRVKWDGTNETSFGTEINNPKYLNVDDNTIYYGFSKLYKTETDSPEQINLTPTYDFAGLINIVDDWLYFRISYNGQKLYRMRTDGSDGEIIY